MTYALPFPDNDYSSGGSCMFSATRAENRGLGFGLLGFAASWVLGPTAAITESAVRRHRMTFDEQRIHAHSDAEALLRASNVLPAQQKAELLRAAQVGPTTPPQELLRAVQTEEQN